MEEDIKYNEDYYERGVEMNISGYSNYRWIPELTIPLAHRILEVSEIKKYDKILDFGCAKGYLVKALRLLHRNAYGYDISDYAKSKVPEDTKPYILENLRDQYFDWVISKDVFEHIQYRELDMVINTLRSMCDNMFVIVPLGYEIKGVISTKRYYAPANELDKTHIIREEIEWWEDKFEECGFEIKHSSYDIKHIKEHYKDWKKSHGFFILKNKYN